MFLEKPSNKNRLEELREIITQAPERVEAEYARSQNSWLACFGSSVFAAETALASTGTKTLLSDEEYSGAMFKLQNLKVRLQDLKNQYPDRETNPPQEMKEELLQALNILEK